MPFGSPVKALSSICPRHVTIRLVEWYLCLSSPFLSNRIFAFCRIIKGTYNCYYTPDACFQHERFLQYAECAYEPRKCFALQCKHAEYIFHDYFLAKLKFTIWLSCENLLSVIKLYCCNRFVFLYDFILDQASLARASRAWERLSINIMGFCYWLVTESTWQEIAVSLSRTVS